MSFKEKTSSLECETGPRACFLCFFLSELSFSGGGVCGEILAKERDLIQPNIKHDHSQRQDPQWGCGLPPLSSRALLFLGFIKIMSQSHPHCWARDQIPEMRRLHSFLCVCFTWWWKMIYHVPVRQHWNTLATGNVCSQHEDVPVETNVSNCVGYNSFNSSNSKPFLHWPLKNNLHSFIF